jgi:hypothetical protein
LLEFYHIGLKIGAFVLLLKKQLLLNKLLNVMGRTRKYAQQGEKQAVWEKKGLRALPFLFILIYFIPLCAPKSVAAAAAANSSFASARALFLLLRRRAERSDSALLLAVLRVCESDIQIA